MSGATRHKAAGDGDEEDVAPARLLHEMHALRDRTSIAGRGYWLPLLLFGALICGSLPFYERLRPSQANSAGLAEPGICTAVLNRPCHMRTGAGHVTVVAALGYYWQIAIPAAVVLIVLWYRWRGNQVGLRTPARGFLITGLVLGELILLGPLLAGQSGSLTRLTHDTHQAGPLVIIAALLWVLAWAQRSAALAIIAAVYLAVALAITQFNNGGLAGGTTGAADLTLTALRLLGLLPALILLAAGSGVWLSQQLPRRPRDPASDSRTG